MSLESQAEAKENRKEKVKITNTAEVDLEVDGTEKQVNQYLISSVLGSGAFSEVFKCQNVYNTEEVYAIKVMSRSFLKRKKEFFRNAGSRRPGFKTALDDVEREIALMKKIHHRNIVNFVELIDDPSGDSIYLVMEFMPCGQVMYWTSKEKRYSTKSKFPEADGTLSIERTLAVLKDISLGLNYLHSNQIVHRDLKPENILIGISGEAKIADFGVAHKLGKTDFHSPSRTAGTPWFLSPELLDSGTQESKAVSDDFLEFSIDIWALGICLHAFLFGRLPFFSEDVSELYSKVISDSPSFSGTEQKKLNCNEAVSTILTSCLKKKTNERIKLPAILQQLQIDSKQVNDFDNVEVTEQDINAAVSVKIDLMTIIRLKMFVRRWRNKSRQNSAGRKTPVNVMSSQSQTIETLSEGSGSKEQFREESSFKKQESGSKLKSNCCLLS